MTEPLGRITIGERAVTKIVSAAVRSVTGTVDYSSGLDKLTRRSYPRFDVQLDEDGDAASIEVAIAVAWPSPVTAIAEQVRSTVIRDVELFTGIPVIRVNVIVGPVVPQGHRVSVEDINTPTPKPRSPVVEPLKLRPIRIIPATPQELLGGKR